ncbi:MAG: DUF2892 domain-containing protein [Rhodobiaceae bacterium]|nr:DUF2892 domain-containing protein [Rhodobiaceae bacterium]
MIPTDITAQEASRLVGQGAVLVDVREASEHARERIAGSILMPLSQIAGGQPDVGDARRVVFYCRSGGRTAAAREHLRPRGKKVQAYILSGGIMAWKRAGLPVEGAPATPVALGRQAQIAAGILVLAGEALGWLVDPAWHALALAAGIALASCGLTGRCPFADLLARMPWNTAANGSEKPS